MWVGKVVDALEALHVDVGVDLGRRDRSVPEHLLDDAYVGAATDEVGGEAVPEGVGRNSSGEAATHRESLRIALHYVFDAPGAEGRAPRAQEEMTGRVASGRRPPILVSFG